MNYGMVLELWLPLPQWASGKAGGVTLDNPVKKDPSILYYPSHSVMLGYLKIPQFRECVNNDAEDDVEADGRDENEERDLVDGQQAEVVEVRNHAADSKWLRKVN